MATQYHNPRTFWLSPQEGPPAAETCSNVEISEARMSAAGAHKAFADCSRIAVVFRPDSDTKFCSQYFFNVNKRPVVQAAYCVKAAAAAERIAGYANAAAEDARTIYAVFCDYPVEGFLDPLYHKAARHCLHGMLFNLHD